MGDYLTIIVALISVVSLFIGAFLNEFLRRKNRREIFAPKIFEKRLAAYEGLVDKIYDCTNRASEVLENENLNSVERHKISKSVQNDMENYIHSNRLYLDDEIMVHCAVMLVGIEDIIEEEKDFKDSIIKHFYESRRDALIMATEASGVAEISKLFRTIHKPNFRGSAIEYYRKEKLNQRSGKSKSKFFW